MIQGVVDDNGVPYIELAVAGRIWRTIIDTGFNGDLELPDALQGQIKADFIGPSKSSLAGGQVIVEDSYVVDIEFDGKRQIAEVSFVPGDEILLGTQLLIEHRLGINFVDQTVVLERVHP